MAIQKWMRAGALALMVAAAPTVAQSGIVKADPGLKSVHPPKKEIVVDWEAALLYPLEDGVPVHRPIVTNNRKEFVERDLGTFTISEKVEDKRSNLYNVDAKPMKPGDEGAVMRFWMRLSGTAQGFHQSGLFREDGPRHQSHGCYRLSRAGARWLFNWAPLGTPVHVVRRLSDSRYASLADVKPKASVARQAVAPVRVAERSR